jgi:AcrR family transcriptional regulator
MPNGASGASEVLDVSATNPERAAVRPGSKSERTRERIFLAAAVTLSRLGYAGTRLSDIADEAGLQAIYYYFESREQLIEEVVTVGTIRLREYVMGAVDAAPAGATALARLDIAVEAHLRQLVSESGFAHAVIRNVGQLRRAGLDVNDPAVVTRCPARGWRENRLLTWDFLVAGVGFEPNDLWVMSRTAPISGVSRGLPRPLRPWRTEEAALRPTASASPVSLRPAASGLQIRLQI